jgi:class 3 adenylate cyclase
VETGDQEELERKLAAIMSADVAGYSRLMEIDEADTLGRLSELRSAIDTLIDQRGGRVAGSAGDSILAEFPSVVEAAACAVEVQQAVTALNEPFEADLKMLLRIGLHVGDVIVQDETIFADGVNVAARLQSLAPAGGICISQLARDHLLNRDTYEFKDLGLLSLKNIARPIQAFELLDSDNAEAILPGDGVGNVSGAEIAFWESIAESTRSDEYLAYLEKYPEGHFSAIARSRLADLPEDGVSDESAVQIELLFWESVRGSGDPKLLRAYLDRYPNGQFAELAQITLESR